MHTVQDGTRSLKFEGVQLAHSSSEGPGKSRWVEFSLFRTSNGKYVVSRTGVSVTFHRAQCPVVKRNGIDPLPEETVADFMVPCRDCRPVRDNEQYLYPETSRHRAQVCRSAEGVLSYLKQYDSQDTEYLTDVARRLLEQASEVDDDISDVFYVEYI